MYTHIQGEKAEYYQKKSHVQEIGNSYIIYEKIKEQNSKIQTYISINLKGTNYLH